MTHEAEFLLCRMYQAFLSRRKSGINKATAKYFYDISEMHEALAPEMTMDDIVETLRELDRAGMVHNFYADNTVQFSCFSDTGLVVMEDRFANKVEKVLDTILTLRQILFP